MLIGSMKLSLKRAVDKKSMNNPLIKVNTITQPTTNFPDVGTNPNVDSNFKIISWVILLGILIVLIIFFFLIRRRKLNKNNENKK